MSESERHDELLAVIRKQGRAAIAAQAAAESCLEFLQEQAPATPDSSMDGVALLKSLLPVFDALERVAGEAKTIQGTSPTWRSRLSGATHREHQALIAGVQLVARQLTDALASAGVQRDAATAIELDSARHRVVEVRASSGADARVLEVVRPGYRLGNVQVRETEVVAGEKSK